MSYFSLQDSFLNQVRKQQVPITMFLTNGFQFKGIVRGFDNYIIVLDCEGRQNIVYKHAVSTIVPIKRVDITVSQQDNNVEPLG